MSQMNAVNARKNKPFYKSVEAIRSIYALPVMSFFVGTRINHSLTSALYNTSS